MTQGDDDEALTRAANAALQLDGEERVAWTQALSAFASDVEYNKLLVLLVKAKALRSSLFELEPARHASLDEVLKMRSEMTLAAVVSLGSGIHGAELALTTRAYGHLQEVPSDRGPTQQRVAQLQVEETIADLDQILSALADGADSADVRLQEGLRFKNRLRSFIEETRDEGVRSQRQLAILMYDAVRRVHAEDLTRNQISALTDCLTHLSSPDLGPGQLSRCDARLVSVGLDSLPDIPE